MEKLFDLKGKKTSDFTCFYRFQCDCLSPEDAMDIAIDKVKEDGKFFTISMYLKPSSFWARLKDAWFILIDKWCWREFVVREEDAQNLSDIFNMDKKYSELP